MAFTSVAARVHPVHPVDVGTMRLTHRLVRSFHPAGKTIGQTAEQRFQRHRQQHF